jgi:hypothetical protein
MRKGGNSAKQTVGQHLAQWSEQLVHHCNGQIDELNQMKDDAEEVEHELNFYQKVIEKGKFVMKVMTWREKVGVAILVLTFLAILYRPPCVMKFPAFTEKV